MKILSNKKYLLWLSFIVTMIFAFIPGIGIRTDGTRRFFGFPAQLLGYYGDGRFSYELLGLLFNVFFYYFIFVILRKVFLKIKKLFLN